MPILNGYKATKRIRRLFQSEGIPRQNQPKIVAITGYKDQNVQRKAMKSGIDKILYKPLNFSEVAELFIELKFID